MPNWSLIDSLNAAHFSESTSYQAVHIDKRENDMSPLKIAVLGNCQARPIAALFGNNNSSHSISYIGIVHLLKDCDKVELFQALDDADLIITQNIADNYPCEFVRTSMLMSRYPNKIMRIANLYFRGYNPELRYIRNGKLGTLRGPLGDYHISTILQTWLEGGSIQQIHDRLQDKQWNSTEYGDIASTSLAQLYARDADLDIPAAALIAKDWRNQHLFFTFNHPSMQLLTRYCTAIAAQFSLDIGDLSINQTSEPLGQFQLPRNPMLMTAQTPDGDSVYTGVEVTSIDEWTVSTGKKSVWSEELLVEAFISIYEANSNFFSESSKAA